MIVVIIISLLLCYFHRPEQDETTQKKDGNKSNEKNSINDSKAKLEEDMDDESKFQQVEILSPDSSI